jgi:hypothetical protein
MRVSAFAKLVVVLSLAGAWLLTGCEQRNQQEALELLRRARVAEGSVSLQGQVQTEMARPEGTVRAQAQVQRTPQRTVIKFTDGPAAGKEIVREKPQPSQAKPPGPSGPWGGEMEQIPPMEALTRRYHVKLGEEASLAGRRVRQVTIQPRQGRSKQCVSLWIDEETGFPLGRERRDAFGRVVYATRYLQVKYSQPPRAPGAAPGVAQAPPAAAAPRAKPAAPEARQEVAPAQPGGAAPVETGPPAQPGAASPGAGGERRFHPHPPAPPSARPGAEAWKGAHPQPQVVSLRQLGQALGFAVGPPGYVPEGFALRRVLLIQQTKPGPRGVLHFSDNVTALTVMVGRRQDWRAHTPPTGAEGPGGAAIVRRPRGTVAVAVRGEAVYLVFGPLPDDTLQRIAASIP